MITGGDSRAETRDGASADALRVRLGRPMRPGGSDTEGAPASLVEAT
jgi:hypothetical protein